MLRASIPYIATSIAFAMLGAALASSAPTIAMVIGCTAGLLFLVGIVEGIRKWRRLSDPYSLDKLREIHLHGDDEPHEEVTELEFDSVVCPHCSTVYDSHLPVCPNCRRAVFTTGLG